MGSLAETINSALQAVGQAAEDRLRDVIADFDGANLTDEERLAAVATAIAANAVAHHGRHKSVYLDAVRTWALEIAAELQPRPMRLRRPVRVDNVEEGAEVLISGLDSLIEMMVGQDTRTQDRLVTELALIARLLGENDVNTIHLAMLAVSRALDSEGYKPGELVTVPLRETGALLDRHAMLESLQPRGCA